MIDEKNNTISYSIEDHNVTNSILDEMNVHDNTFCEKQFIWFYMNHRENDMNYNIKDNFDNDKLFIKYSDKGTLEGNKRKNKLFYYALDNYGIEENQDELSIANNIKKQYIKYILENYPDIILIKQNFINLCQLLSKAKIDNEYVEYVLLLCKQIIFNINKNFNLDDDFAIHIRKIFNTFSTNFLSFISKIY